MMVDYKTFVEVCAAVSRNPKISPGAKALYFYFLTNPDSHRETVCKEMNISKDTFYKYVKELKESGLFRTDYFNVKGASKKCTYRALLLTEKPDSEKNGSEKTGSENPESPEEILKGNNNINNINNNNSSLQKHNNTTNKKSEYTNSNSSSKKAEPAEKVPGRKIKNLPQTVKQFAEYQPKKQETIKEQEILQPKKQETVKEQETSQPKGNSPGMLEAYVLCSAGFTVSKWTVLQCKEQVAERLKIPVSLSSLLFKRCQNDVSLVGNVLYQIENAKKKVRNIRAYLVTVLKPDNWEVFRDNVISGFISGTRPDRESVIEFLRWFFKYKPLPSTA